MTCAPLLLAALLLSAPGNVRPVMQVGRLCAAADGNRSEARLIRDAEDGQFDEFSLLEAAILAGGSTDSIESRQLAQRFARWTERRDWQAVSGNEKDVARRVFDDLHREILTGRYQVQCSDPAVTLREGDFNCVSATILYIAALRAAGLSAEGSATVGHVYCRVGEDRFDVETTCDRWFTLAPDAARRARQRAARRHGRARGTPRRLNDVALVAKIYYNRGVARFRSEAFEEGMLLTRQSLRLDPHDEIAHSNVLAGLNNWALCLCRQEEFSQAAEMLDELKRLDPDYPSLAENEAHLYRLWGEQRSSHSDRPAAEIHNPRG